jgi:predicted transcriptional regulator
MRHIGKPMVTFSTSIDPDKLARVDAMAGRRGRSRFMEEAIDLRLEQGKK